MTTDTSIRSYVVPEGRLSKMLRVIVTLAMFSWVMSGLAVRVWRDYNAVPTEISVQPRDWFNSFQQVHMINTTNISFPDVVYAQTTQLNLEMFTLEELLYDESILEEKVCDSFILFFTSSDTYKYVEVVCEELYQKRLASTANQNHHYSDHDFCDGINFCEGIGTRCNQEFEYHEHDFPEQYDEEGLDPIVHAES